MTNPIEELKRLEERRLERAPDPLTQDNFVRAYGPDYRQIALGLAADYLAFAEEVQLIPEYGITDEGIEGISAKITALRSITEPGRRQNHGF